MHSTPKVYAYGDIESREGSANCITDRKLAKTTTVLTVALKCGR